MPKRKKMTEEGIAIAIRKCEAVVMEIEIQLLDGEIDPEFDSVLKSILALRAKMF